MILPTMPSVTANVLVCEAVVPEKNNLLSAIRILNILTVRPGIDIAHFKTLSIINGFPGDALQHILSVQMVSDSDGVVVAASADSSIVLVNQIDPFGPRTYFMTTNFDVELQHLGDLGFYIIRVLLDGVPIGYAPLTLRRGYSAL